MAFAVPSFPLLAQDLARRRGEKLADILLHTNGPFHSVRTEKEEAASEPEREPERGDSHLLLGRRNCALICEFEREHLGPRETFMFSSNAFSSSKNARSPVELMSIYEISWTTAYRVDMHWNWEKIVMNYLQSHNNNMTNSCF